MSLVVIDDKKNNFGYLFYTLVVFLTLGPYFANTSYGENITSVLFTILLGMSVYVIRQQKHFILLAIILSAFSIVGHWLANTVFLQREFALIDLVLSAVFLGLMTAIVISYILEDRRVNAGTLYGAICAYLLIGLTWSLVYTVIYLVDPSAFQLSQKVPPRANPAFEYFLYYSYVTLTTVGYGDILPMSTPARTLSWMEAVTGQIYLTVWLAQLVGTYISKKVKKSES